MSYLYEQCNSCKNDNRTQDPVSYFYDYLVSMGYKCIENNWKELQSWKEQGGNLIEVDQDIEYCLFRKTVASRRVDTPALFLYHKLKGIPSLVVCDDLYLPVCGYESSFSFSKIGQPHEGTIEVFVRGGYVQDQIFRSHRAKTGMEGTKQCTVTVALYRRIEKDGA